MNAYIQNLKAYLSQRPLRYGYDDADSLLGLLRHCYLEENPIENAVIHFSFQKLNGVLEKLTISENDQVFFLTCQLCTEYANRAFSEGLRTGIQLAMELSELIDSEA